MKIWRSNHLSSTSRVLACRYWETAKILNLVSCYLTWDHGNAVTTCKGRRDPHHHPEHPRCSPALHMEHPTFSWLLDALTVCVEYHIKCSGCVETGLCHFLLWSGKGNPCARSQASPMPFYSPTLQCFLPGHHSSLSHPLGTALRLRHGRSCMAQGTHSHSTVIKKKNNSKPTYA